MNALQNVMQSQPQVPEPAGQAAVAEPEQAMIGPVPVPVSQVDLIKQVFAPELLSPQPQ